LILRPFFTPLVPIDSADIYDGKNWKFGTFNIHTSSVNPPQFLIFILSDLTTSEFPGIYPRDGGFYGPRPTPDLHPNMRLEETMTSVPKVNPGDAVFWHCDVVHSVEQDHIGEGDSAG